MKNNKNEYESKLKTNKIILNKENNDSKNKENENCKIDLNNENIEEIPLLYNNNFEGKNVSDFKENYEFGKTKKNNIKNDLIQNSKEKIKNINQNNSDKNLEENEIHGQKRHKIINSNSSLNENEKININNNNPSNKIIKTKNYIKYKKEQDLDSLSSEDECNTPKINTAKRAVNNKFIYSKEKNVFFVDENDDSDVEINYKSNKISRVNKNSANNQSNENISSSESEEIISEFTNSNKEEEEEDENENINENYNKLNNEEKEIYLLELEDNGLPNLQNDEILSCNINSIINISVYNGLLISKNIRLITNSENEFPTPFYLDEIINEINLKSQKVSSSASSHSLENQKNIDENSIIKSLKKYKIYPCKINTKIYFRVSCVRPGNIFFVFMYKDESNKIKFTKPFNILVNPLIDLNNNKLLEINQIQMQSIIPKYIGNISIDFEKYYKEATLLEYNFIHFHSFQELGNNENIYNIKNQNELSDELFNEKLDINQKYKLLHNSIKNLKNKYHIGSVTDIILTHTSSESNWIYENDDFTYNLKNTPWLNVSYELDKILIKYSKLFAAKKVSYKLAPYIYNISNINQIISEISNYIDKANLEEFFMISEEKYLNKFKNFHMSFKNEEFRKNYLIKKNIVLNEIDKAFEGDREEKLNQILTDFNYMIRLISQSCINYGYERLGVKMCVEFVGIIIIESYKEKNNTKKIPSERNFLKEVQYFIKIINEKWINEIKELLKISISNIKEYLRYKYLQLNNKKKISQLIESYFVVKNENNPSEIYLSNGWIMNSEDSNVIFLDTVKYGTWNHLKRKIIIIPDTIKINYGKNIENTSIKLLNYMEKYISNLSSIFDGLYIDSISYIPNFVLKHLIYIARKVNPSIILICNISTSNKIKENNNISLLKKKYTEELGINLFITELIWNNNETEIINSLINNGSSCNSNIYSEIITHFSKNLYSSSFIDENRIKFGKFKYLKSKKPFNIIYDLYDSQTYYEKYKKLNINIPILSLIGILDTSIGSIYGFDQLYPFLTNLEREKRKYDINNDQLKILIEKINNKENNADETYEVFFEYHPDESQKQTDFNKIYSVHLALDIFNYNPDIELTKITNNLYMTKTRLPPGKYYYQYVLNDNIWTYDNTQPTEEDSNGIKYNIIDLRNHNRIIIPDIKIFRKEINNIRNYFKNKESEIYIQKNQNMYGIIRMSVDPKSLINNNINENKVIQCKNKISYLSEENNNYDSDYENDEEINNSIYTSPDIKKRISKPEIISKSYENLDNNNDDDSLLFNVNKNLMNSVSMNLNRNEMNIDSFKNKNQKEKKDKTILEASMKMNLEQSEYNLKNKKIDDFYNQIYNGYAAICFPSFENKNMTGKGQIIIPGKISDLICICHFNEEKIDITSIIKDKKLIGARNEIFFTKELNYLKSFAKIKYIENKTIIDFNNAPPNLGLIIKFMNDDKKYDINYLDDNLEILFNKGNEFINYFDILDINKLLFMSENEERENTNNKTGTYEMGINLFKDIYQNSYNNRELRNKKIKSIYAGINELIELIKLIKRSENQNLFDNRSIQFEDYEKYNNDNKIFNTNEDKKLKIQSLYKDICDNDNYIKYIIERLSNAESFKLMYNFIKKLILPKYKSLPPFLKPLYFEKIIISIYQTIIRISLSKMPSYILNFGDFAIGLSLSKYEFIKKYLICSFDNKLIKKYDSKNKQNLYKNLIGLSISSGLPKNDKNNKISTRDILISFNSLFIIPRLHSEAKLILKLIGSTMKYGLIPDKIDNSNNYKYNSRDIPWLYIRAIKSYIYSTLDFNFLKEEIYLLNVPENVNDSYTKQKIKKNKKILSIENIIQLIFQYHAQGISFIDKKKEKQPYQRRPQLKKNKNNLDIDGLKINIYLDSETGFIYGGNKLNVGTWMDHIGSSYKAKNNNIPSTPRNGADIEIIALLFNCLNFIIELNYKNYYSYKNVLLNNNEEFSFVQWSFLIKKNFEQKFFVNKIYSSIQNKCNIYKDYIIKPQKGIDNLNNQNDELETNIEKYPKNDFEELKNEYKLRPNILLAIYYAPDLFSYENILKVIDNIEKYLLRPEIQSENNVNGIYGVKTLDKTDNDYNGKLDYKDTNNFKTSCGFNIHNGVEFVWLYGIYLMIKIKYLFNFNYDNIENNKNDYFIPEKIEEMIRFTSKKLIPYIKYMKENKYMGIPEIIDEIGNVFNEGNQSDLKSLATFFELINKLAWISDKAYIYDNSDDDITSKDEEED